MKIALNTTKQRFEAATLEQEKRLRKNTKCMTEVTESVSEKLNDDSLKWRLMHDALRSIRRVVAKRPKNLVTFRTVTD